MKKENEINCQQARRFYFDYLTGQDSSEWRVEYEHIQQCSQCQAQVRQLQTEMDKTEDSRSGRRSDILALHYRCLSEWVDCDVVKPFLASQAHPELNIQNQTPVTVHIEHCQTCQKDIRTILSLGLSGSQLAEATQILSNESVSPAGLKDRELAAIEAIRNRKSSGVVTRLHLDTQGQAHIQVRPAQEVHPRRYFLARFAAAAGVLIVASLIIMMTTTAGGVSIQAIYSAIQAVENCKIEIRDVEIDTPSQKILISRKFNLALSQRKDETVILDFQNKRILKSTPRDGIVIEPSELEISSQINRADFGLLPFDSIVHIPAGHQWQRQDLLSEKSGYEVYDLIWTDASTAGPGVEKKWRGYLQKNSHLPVRIEWFEKFPGQAEEKITETTIQYPDSQVVLGELKDIPLYRLLKGDQIE